MRLSFSRAPQDAFVPGENRPVSTSNRVRYQRILREAEGYLELNLPENALGALARMKEPGSFNGHKLYLTGEALRALERYSEAAQALEEATELNPSNISAWLALGWCLKRSGRLDQAIHALERARDVDSEQAIIHYNLACYWSLAGKKEPALESLSRAIALQPDYRELVGDETDFDPLRADPDFQALTSIIV
jgi:tetratricopeptide (TPR) repeat protein